jgi:hypothetical protein
LIKASASPSTSARVESSLCQTGTETAPRPRP